MERPDESSIGPVAPGERDDVLRLASRSLGWTGDERDREFFAWKHDQNPFGSSYAIGARVDGELVGFRTLMRWRLERGVERLSMVRAVDTATDPAHQGKGIFTTLTRAAIEDLTAEGVDAVFNTPNEQSRPGYFKMGWQVVGRPTLLFHPRSPGTAVRMLRARVAAEKWSEPVTIGEPAPEAAAQAVEASRSRRGWATPRTPEFVRWRFGFEPLGYRAVEVRGGVAVVRVRRRAGLREVVVAAWLSDRRDPRALRRIVSSVGDYAIAAGIGAVKVGMVPVPRRGPVLTWRPLASGHVPSLGELDLTMGDLELF